MSTALAAHTHVRVRPPAAALGLHQLSYALLGFQASLIVLSVIGFSWTGLSIVWLNLAPIALSALIFWGLWAFHAATPGRKPSDWAACEAMLALALFMMLGGVIAPLQYVGLALRFPLIDSWLASADAALGFHVPSLVAWTRAHPMAELWLHRAYFTFLPQLALPIAVIGCWYRDRETLWEYVFNLHVCATLPILCLTLWPAACVYTYYGYEPTLNPARFIAHFTGLRAGTMTIVDPLNIEGMVSLPSFHAAGAAIVTWSFRKHRPWLIVLLIVNAGLVAATFMTGVHYVVDVIASVPLVALSIWLWRRFGARWLDPIAHVEIQAQVNSRR